MTPSLIIQHRIELRRKFELGHRPNNGSIIEDYRRNRDDPYWRISRMMEEICEYVLYLEDQKAALTLLEAGMPRLLEESYQTRKKVLELTKALSAVAELIESPSNAYMAKIIIDKGLSRG